MKQKTQNKPINPAKTYNRKFKCNNCGGKTDCPAWVGAKLYCQKCMVYRRVHLGAFPDKETIKDLKEIGRWKH